MKKKKKRITVYIRNSMHRMLYKEFITRKEADTDLTITKFLQLMILEYLIVRDVIAEHPEAKEAIAHELMKWSVDNPF